MPFIMLGHALALAGRRDEALVVLENEPRFQRVLREIGLR